MSYIVVYLDTQLKQVKGLWHHAIIINVTCFALFVHRQALAPATITYLFFVVIKALSLLFQTPLIHGFPFFTSWFRRWASWGLEAQSHAAFNMQTVASLMVPAAARRRRRISELGCLSASHCKHHSMLHSFIFCL